MKRTNFSNRSDFKLSFERPRYSCDPKTNTVRCELSYTINSPMLVSQDSEKYQGVFRELAVNPCLGGGTVVGTAVCSAEDTFDKHTGREIAEARAEQLAYSEAASIIDAYISKMLAFYTEAYNQFMVKAAHVVGHNIKYVAKLGGNDEPDDTVFADLVSIEKVQCEITKADTAESLLGE